MALIPCIAHCVLFTAANSIAGSIGVNLDRDCEIVVLADDSWEMMDKEGWEKAPGVWYFPRGTVYFLEPDGPPSQPTTRSRFVLQPRFWKEKPCSRRP